MKKLEVYFYKTISNREPVKEWLKSLALEDQKIISQDLTTVQYGWPIGMPIVEYLNQGLWQMRSRLTGGRTTRVIFFMHQNQMILVSGFFKKTTKTPLIEIELAYKRKRLFENENKHHEK